MSCALSMLKNILIGTLFTITENDWLKCHEDNKHICNWWYRLNMYKALTEKDANKSIIAGDSNTLL